MLHDETGDNVSPVLLWRSSLMAMAARDPYYLAVVSEQPDALCVRCHAPAGTEEIKDSGGTLDFDALVAATTPAATLGRQLQPQPPALGHGRDVVAGVEDLDVARHLDVAGAHHA